MLNLLNEINYEFFKKKIITLKLKLLYLRSTLYSQKFDYSKYNAKRNNKIVLLSNSNRLSKDISNSIIQNITRDFVINRF